MTTSEVNYHWICKFDFVLIIAFSADFKCRGGWTDNETNYLIASSNEDDIRQYCLAYYQNENRLQMTISSDTCVRKATNPVATTHRENHLALSLVNKGLYPI